MKPNLRFFACSYLSLADIWGRHDGTCYFFNCVGVNYWFYCDRRLQQAGHAAKSLQKCVKNAYTRIDVQLQRRYDLIPNLVFNFFSELFATHPPLSQRIRKLQLVEGQYAASAPTVSSLINENHNSVMGFAEGTPTARSFPSQIPSTRMRSNLIQVTSEQVIAQVGTVTPEQVAQTQAWLDQFPENIQTGLRNQQQAKAIVYSLMIRLENQTIYQKQIDWLRQIESIEMANNVLQFSQAIRTLDARMRLPLLDLTVPVLRQYSTSECQKLFKNMNTLAKAAGRWSLNDFVIYLVLFHRLKPCPQPANSTQHTKLEPIWTDCLLLQTVYCFCLPSPKLDKRDKMPLPMPFDRGFIDYRGLADLNYLKLLLPVISAPWIRASNAWVPLHPN